MMKKKPGRLTRELLETAHDMRRVGLLDASTCEKITMRHPAAPGTPQLVPITPKHDA